MRLGVNQKALLAIIGTQPGIGKSQAIGYVAQYNAGRIHVGQALQKMIAAKLVREDRTGRPIRLYLVDES